MSDLKAYILFPVADKSPLYTSWMPQCPIPAEIVREYDTGWMPPSDAGIVITHLHYRWEEISILRRIVEADSVPVLILSDGILEYRNTFEHPELGDGAVFQPLMGHKLACIGRSQARWIESWGNVGKCEVVGFPRLDNLAAKCAEPLSNQQDERGEFHLLVASARNPYFTDEQRAETIRALNDVLEFVNETPALGDRKLRVSWRLTDELHNELRVPPADAPRTPIQQVLARVDAVITTPSTIQLEASMLRKPVAVLDYHRSPQMTAAAWTISASAHVGPVVRELADPSPPRMLIQDALLHDNLQCREPAVGRLAQLIERMVQCGHRARCEDRSLEFPLRMIGDEDQGFAPVEATSELSRLFPNNPAFRDQSLLRLQSELSQAIKEMGSYPDKYFAQRAANRRSRGYINWLRTVLRNRAAMIEKLSQQYHALKGPQQGEGAANRQGPVADRSVKKD